MRDDGVNVTEAGVLRAVRAEARQDERTRVLDQLRVAADRSEREAAAYRRHASVTRAGRRALGLRQAIELVERAEPVHAGEEWSAAGSHDSVEIHWYDPPEEPDEQPVRLVANDNADAVTACVYLSLDEAEQAFRDGLALVEKLRRERAERAGEAT